MAADEDVEVSVQLPKDVCSSLPPPAPLTTLVAHYYYCLLYFLLFKFQNQKIRTLAREVDPTGSRSIGVLTKPDKIEVDTESTTIDILLDRKYELRYGYFVVRTPKQTELNSLLEEGVSPEVARNVVSMNIGLILEYN